MRSGIEDVVKRLLPLSILALVVSCDVAPQVPQRRLRDTPTDTSYCRAAADNLFMLGCEGFVGFEAACTEAEKHGTYLVARCLSEIVTCAGVRRCLRDRVQ